MSTDSASSTQIGTSASSSLPGGGLAKRGRAGSVSDALQEVTHYTQGGTDPGSPTTQELKRHERGSEGVFKDLLTFRWMTEPASSAKMIGLILLLWTNWRIFTPSTPNPFDALILLSHRVPTSVVALNEPKALLTGDLIRYQKGYGDLAFLAFYVVVFSFLRQTTTRYIFRPFASWWGIKNHRKQERFVEQGYAILYWGTAGAFGIWVMSFQDSWWYETKHFWLKYPHWVMRPELKAYYLIQFSYWLQQALVMLLRLEAPRKDYYELIAHHLVTLWLVGWSYLINLTMIGTTVFVCMDVPDTFLAIAKLLNYLGLDLLATIVFAGEMLIWAYFRLYLSAITIWSVYTEFDLIPEHTKEWNPKHGWWLVGWMKWQVFTPQFLLLLLNIMWFFMMIRVIRRALKGIVEDDREADEYADDDDEAKRARKEAEKLRQSKKAGSGKKQ